VSNKNARSTDKSHRIRQLSAAGSGFRLANTLIMPVPARAQPGPRLGFHLRDDVSPAVVDARLAGAGAGADPLLSAGRRQACFPAACAQTCG
jgi:hypothetical protein